MSADEALGAVDHDRPRRMRPGHAVGQDEGARSGRKHDVDRPGGEVLGDHGAQPLGERWLGGDQGLLDVLAGVMTRGKKDVIVGMIGAGALEDLEMDLLADLGLDGDGILLGRADGHPFLLQVASLSHAGRYLRRVLDSGPCASWPYRRLRSPVASLSSTL